MTTKLLTNWAGLVSVGWMVAGYAFIRFVLAPLDVRGPFWLYAPVLYLCWLGAGLWLAIRGLRHGEFRGRICSLIALGVFLILTWLFWYPVFRTDVRVRGASVANHPAPGKAGIASLLAIGHHRPGLPEPGRSP